MNTPAEALDAGYRARLAGIHRELGIPDDYAVSRGLILHAEAPTVVPADTDPDGKEVYLAPEASRQWTLLSGAAKAEGVVILAYSGFRSVERQTQLIRAKLAAGKSLEDILRYVAAPGYSEHHTGRAIDVGTAFEPPLEESFSQTSAYFWLTQRAKDFGFVMSYPRGNRHGIGYEPWHWCWRS